MRAIFINGPLANTMKEFPYDYPTVEVAKIKPINYADPLEFPVAEKVTYYRVAETTIPHEYIFSIEEPNVGS